MRFATQTIRVGQEPEGEFKPVIPPIYQSATFAWNSLDELPRVDYTRVTNPTRIALEEVVASIERGTHCTVFGSGMAAVMGALSLLQQGDHLLMASDIYGGTYRVAYKVLPKQGIEVTEFDGRDLDSIRAAIRPNSKMLIFESPTNPNLRLMDIAAIVALAREHGLITVFDNTFASPYLQNPLEFGVDVVLHSMTKYINGHSDVISGCTVTRNAEFGAHFAEYIRSVGSVPSPFDCWLNLRGVKTLELRMRRHCENAQAVAEYLEAHPRVKRVHFPGLPSHPDHELAKRQMRGFGGMVAVELDGTGEQARRVAESTQLFLLAESLGGVESLLGYPPVMSHATMSEEERLKKGIPPTLLRLSCGIEDPQDLIDDLEQAIARM